MLWLQLLTTIIFEGERKQSFNSISGIITTQILNLFTCIHFRLH